MKKSSKKKNDKDCEEQVKKKVGCVCVLIGNHLFDKYSQPYAEFTELEVVHLWNTFQIDFPEDTINKLQMTELVRRIFPRCEDELSYIGAFKNSRYLSTDDIVSDAMLKL